MSRAMATPSARAASAVVAFAMRAKISSGMDTRNSFFMNSALRVAGQRPDAGHHRNLAVLDLPQELFQQANVEDRLRDRQFRAGFDLVFEAADLLVDVGAAGIGAHRDHEARSSCRWDCRR